MDIDVHIPIGAKPSDPLGGNPVKAQSSMSFSSSSRVVPSAANDFEHLSPANWKQQPFLRLIYHIVFQFSYYEV